MLCKLSRKLHFQLLLIGLFFIPIISSAQPFSCGTYDAVFPQIIQTLDSNAVSVQDKMNKKFVVTAHIVKDTLGGYNYSITDAVQLFADVEASFQPINATFEVCEALYIDNWQYAHYIDTANANEYSIVSYKANTINVYFVKRITVNNGEAAGLGTLPCGQDVVFMTKDADAGVLAHELGHFFGMLHTEDTNHFGSELVNGSNCTTAGDLICDTEADFDGGGACPITVTSIDANGDFYTPPIYNIMSKYDCGPQSFTSQQYNAMVAVYKNLRSNLW